MTPSWDSVKVWAERELERARSALENVTAEQLPAQQARVAVLRELLALPDTRDPENRVGEENQYPV